MCIIVAVPANVALPPMETLHECFRRNPDGAGFMWSDGKKVHIRKGFMEWKDFEEAFEKELPHIYTDSAVVFHFRITTSGRTQPKCCHPFPVSSEVEDLQATEISCRFGVAHNGVIQGMSTRDGWSDTMDFVAGVVAPLARMHPSFMYSEDAKVLLKNACKSKLAIINHAGEMMLVGDFVTEDGVHYSNSTYKPYESGWTSYGNWWRTSYDLDWDDDPWEEDKTWDAIKYEWESCEVCPMQLECSAEQACCSDEIEALNVCADFNDCTKSEVLEMLGYAPELLSAE